MKVLKSILLSLILAVLLAGGSYYWLKNIAPSPQEKDLPAVIIEQSAETEKSPYPYKVEQEIPSQTSEIILVGPRDNIPKDAPKEQGFWSFSYPIPGILSRSGQPTIQEFKWLKKQGFRSIVDMRDTTEYGEAGDDRKIPGFAELNFNYLYLPTADGQPPTNTDANKFLAFIQNQKNQPVHVHCRGGIGRAGTMVALARVKLQGWPLEKAIEESRLYKNGISSAQLRWLKEYISRK